MYTYETRIYTLEFIIVLMASFQNFAGQTNRSPSQIRNSSRAIRQQFNYFAVIDFEVTCEANSSMPSQPYIQEIIEFPIVIIDVHKRTIVKRSYLAK